MNLLVTDLNNILIHEAGWLGPWEITAIVVVVLLLFGGRKIPELMKGLGKGMKEFKEGIGGEDDKKDNTDNADNKDAAK
jgi:sec-independent protein translocase protein TatA